MNNQLFKGGSSFTTSCLRAVWMVAVIVLATIPVLAQQSVGTILGVVRDTSGGTVAGATVTISNTETALSRSVTTGEDGAFRLPALPVGHYTVKIEKDGFKTQTRQGMVLDVAQDLVVNASLEVGSSAQEVVVSGEAPIVNTTTSALGGLVNEQKMDELPLNGRNFIDLSLMQPGVVKNIFQGTGGGMAGTWFSSNGSPTRSNYVTLDGAPMINQLGGATGSEGGTTLGVDGIREYRVITNNFGAEYGMTMGSQMVVVTKSGSNQWHGSGFEYLRNDHLDARNFFDTAQTAGKTASGQQRRLPPFQRNNFGASAGGPIRKDKTFFYATYEGLRQNVGFTALDTVIAGACHPAVANAANNWGAGTVIWNGSGTQPIGSIGPCTQLGSTGSVTLSATTAPLLALMPFDTANPTSNNYSTSATNKLREDFGQIRVDQNISAADSLFGRFTISDAFLNNGSGSISSAKSGVAFPQYWHASSPSRNQFYTVSESHVFSGALLNTVRLSFSRTNFSLASDVSSAFRNSPGKNVEFVAGRPMGNFQNVSGMSNFGTPIGSGPNPPSYHVQNIYTLSDDVFYTRGKHAFKFGVLFNRFNQAMASAQSPSGQVFFPNIAGVLSGVYNQYIAQTQGINQTFDFIYNTFGVYAQDDFRATSKLTFNLGLRYEINTTPHELNGVQAAFRNPFADASSTPGPIISNPSLHNFSPRLGFAYDVQGNGKTAIRGGFGLYYDIGNIGNALYQGVISLPPLISQSLRTNPTGLQLDLPFFSNLPAIPAPNTLQTIQYGLSQPQMLAYNLTVERQFPGNLGLAVSYVGTRGTHLFTEMEANPNVPSAFVNGVPQWFPYLCSGVRSLTNTGSCTLSTAAYALQTARMNPNWSTIVLDATASQSWYNSLQVVLNKRLGHGLQFQSAYTWSHSLDVAQGQGYSTDCSGAAMASGMDPFNPRFDTGPSCFDVTHNWRFNLLYHLPTVKSTGLVSKLANGWWMGNIVSINSGYPFSPAESTNRSLSGQFAGKVIMERASIGTATIAPGATVNGSTNTTTTSTFIPYDASKVIKGNPSQWFNPLMFQLQPIGTFGTASRGLLRGPGLGTWDFSLVKDTSIPFLGERGNLQFRAEFFNLLNRANFGMPAGVIFGGAQTASNLGPYTESPASNAGKITSTSTDPREIQFALKLVF